MEDITINFIQKGKEEFSFPFNKYCYMKEIYKKYAQKTGEFEENIYFTCDGFKMNPDVKLFTVIDNRNSLNFEVNFYNIKYTKRHSMMYIQAPVLKIQDIKPQDHSQVRKRNTMAVIDITNINKQFNKTFNDNSDKNNNNNSNFDSPRKISKKFSDKNLNKKNKFNNLYESPGKKNFIEQKKKKRYSTIDNIPKKLFEKKTNEIILCPKCQTNPIITFDKYKIFLANCKNNHQFENLNINDYEKVLDNYKPKNNLQIQCDNCKYNIRNEINQFYICLDCDKNLCAKCTVSHRNMSDEHIIIEYENKNYYCIFHNKKFVAYCTECKKNLCLKCKKDHDIRHCILSYKNELTDEKFNEIKEGVIQIKNQISSFKHTIKSIIKKLKYVVKGIESYSKLTENLINNYNEKYKNYQIIKTLININYNMVLNDINKIINEEDAEQQLNYAFKLYEKMSPYDPYNDSFSKSSDDETSNCPTPKKNKNKKCGLKLKTGENNDDSSGAGSYSSEEENENNDNQFSNTYNKYNDSNCMRKITEIEGDNEDEQSENNKINNNNLNNNFIDNSKNVINDNSNPNNNNPKKTKKKKITKKKKHKKDNNNNFDNNINKNFQPEEEEYIDPNKLSEATMTYKYLDDDTEIQIFGDYFVSTNKNNCKMIIDGVESEITNILKIDKKYPNNTIIIKLKETSKITDMSKIFCNCATLISLPEIANWNFSNVTNISYFFYHCTSLRSLPEISKWKINSVTDLSFIFGYCTALKKIPEIGKWNTSKVTNMSCMFRNCTMLESIPEIGNWDTSNVNNMSGMFAYCFALETLTDISNWDTKNVTTLANMFEHCRSMKKLPDINKWDISKVTNKNRMFEACSPYMIVPVKFEEYM